jgi:hypothetical protein
MFQLLIKIVAIGTNNFVIESMLYRRNHSPNSLNIMYSTQMKSNVAQKLLLFPSSKHKKCEMQQHKDSDNISVKCKYCNYAPKS